MKIFLDDIREAPDETWTVARNFSEFVDLFFSTEVIEEISFDHDLGEIKGTNELTGYDCLCEVEQAVYRGTPAPKMHIHSANAGARKKMELAIKAIQQRAA